MPSQAVIGGKLQPDLRVDVRRRLPSAAHDQRELDHVGRADLHGLCFHITNTGGRAMIAWKTEQIFTSLWLSLSFGSGPEGKCWYCLDINALLIAEIFWLFLHCIQKQFSIPLLVWQMLTNFRSETELDLCFCVLGDVASVVGQDMMSLHGYDWAHKYSLEEFRSFIYIN